MDDLDTLAKSYEALAEGPALDGRGWMGARLDGRNFSALTRGLAKPFDAGFSKAMAASALAVARGMGACLAYQQSDEISLFWGPSEEPLPFNGRRSKWLSLLASLGTSALIDALHQEGLADLARKLPHFDARLLAFSDLEAAAITLAWRARDARRNAIHAAARCRYGARELHGIHQNGMLAMLEAAGAPFDALPEAFRNGVLLAPVLSQRTLTADERAAIPAAQRPAKNATFQRRAMLASSRTWPDRRETAASLLEEAHATMLAQRADSAEGLPAPQGQQAHEPARV